MAVPKAPCIGGVRFRRTDTTTFDIEAFLDRMYGRLSDATLVERVEVFRRLYTAVGFGIVVAPTRLPGIAQLLHRGCGWFAKNRLRLTGRCADGACELPAGPKKT